MKNLIEKAIEKFCQEAGIGLYSKRLVEKVCHQFVLPTASQLDLKQREQVEKFYLNQVVHHKVAVYQAGVNISDSFFGLGIDEVVWQLAIHDLSKFSENELAFALYNFKNPESNSPTQKEGFELAKHHHVANNPHHPEHWWRVSKDGVATSLPMPRKYVAELVADWIGGNVYGTPIDSWLQKNLPRFRFHANTVPLLKNVLKGIGIEAFARGDSSLVIS